MTLRIIGGQFRGRLLKAPKGSSTRPTQGMLREAVFNICQNQVEGCRFLDLFAGSGAMGLEALSRGAAHAVFVESNLQAMASIKENIAALQVVSQTELLAVKAEKAIQILSKQSEQFDIVYIDPPYADSAAPLLDSLEPILSRDATIFIEERSSPKPKPIHPPSFLSLKDSRRFGVALLHQFRNKFSNS